MLKLLRFILLDIVLIVSGCGYEKETKIVPAPAPAPGPNPGGGGGNGGGGGGGAVDFNRDVRPIVEEHCALSGCHGSGPFQSADAFVEFGGPRRVQNGSMPPNYSPKYSQWTDTDKQIILLWYDQNL